MYTNCYLEIYRPSVVICPLPVAKQAVLRRRARRRIAVRTAIRCNGRLTTDNGRSALCWRRAAGLGGRINQRDHESATNLPRWCLKIRAQDYTPKCDFNRENRAKMKTACATSRGVLRQIRDVGKLSQNYLSLVFPRFRRIKSWRICQMLSQNSRRRMKTWKCEAVKT